MSKWHRLILPLALVGILGIGCDDDGGGTTMGPTINDVAGDWNMTAGTLTPNLTGTAIDLTTLATIELDIDVNGDFELTITQPGPVVTMITGTLTITGNNTATLTNDADPGDPLPATFSLTNNDNTLSVQVEDAELLDITMDGMVNAADAGDLNITFAREMI